MQETLYNAFVNGQVYLDDPARLNPRPSGTVTRERGQVPCQLMIYKKLATTLVEGILACCREWKAPKSEQLCQPGSKAGK